MSELQNDWILLCLCKSWNQSHGSVTPPPCGGAQELHVSASLHISSQLEFLGGRISELHHATSHWRLVSVLCNEMFFIETLTSTRSSWFWKNAQFACSWLNTEQWSDEHTETLCDIQRFTATVTNTYMCILERCVWVFQWCVYEGILMDAPQ